MKTCHKCGVKKPDTEFHKDSRCIDGLYSVCKECHNIIATNYRKNNPEKTAASLRVYRKKNLDKHALHNATSRKNNKESVNINCAARRAKKLQATPGWACPIGIKAMYIMAAWTGQTVDHIVPLKSKLVCGLHTPANMQVISFAANAAKGNRLWPDMP